MIAAACTCSASMAVDLEHAPRMVFGVAVCAACGQPWAVCAVRGEVASQVMLGPDTDYEGLYDRLRLYAVRAFLGQWEGSEMKAAYAAVWRARILWETEDPWGRRIVALMGLPVLRWLNLPPLWLTARLFGWLGMPEHLRGATVKAPEADQRRIRRITRGLA